MADAWGRLTEQAGVALVTAGPGHLNALGALYTARMAEAPCVLLSGAAPLARAGRGAFQETDQVATARPLAWQPASADRLGEDVARALAIAESGRPGPAHLSLPSDLLADLDEAPLREVLTRLAEGRRPLILLGPALARHQAEEQDERGVLSRDESLVPRRLAASP